MAGKKTAVAYAEEDLGVQSVYEDAQTAQERFTAARGELVGMRNNKRRIENLIAQREADIAMEVFSEGGASQAAIERETKLRIGTDDSLRELRDQLLEQQYDIDGEETAAAIAKQLIEIDVARMTELGGYLQYLAAAKSAVRDPRPDPTKVSPWG